MLKSKWWETWRTLQSTSALCARFVQIFPSLEIKLTNLGWYEYVRRSQTNIQVFMMNVCHKSIITRFVSYTDSRISARNVALAPFVCNELMASAGMCTLLCGCSLCVCVCVGSDVTQWKCPREMNGSRRKLRKGNWLPIFWAKFSLLPIWYVWHALMNDILMGIMVDIEHHIKSPQKAPPSNRMNFINMMSALRCLTWLLASFDDFCKEFERIRINLMLCSWPMLCILMNSAIIHSSAITNEINRGRSSIKWRSAISVYANAHTHTPTDCTTNRMKYKWTFAHSRISSKT